MPIFSSSTTEESSQFSVCKIEAGKAVLLSEDFELLEFPAKLLPSSHASEVKIKVESCPRRRDLSAALADIRNTFAVSSEDVARIKECINAEGFLRTEAVGCTCASISWRDNLNSLLRSIRGGASVLCEAVDLVCLTTLQSIPIEDGQAINRLRIDMNLSPELEVAVLFRTSIGAFWTRSLTLRRAEMSESDYSGITIITDLPSSDVRLQKIAKNGGKIAHTAIAINNYDCITAVVTSTPSSDLYSAASKASLPIVNYEWLDLLVTLNRIPFPYSDFVPKIKQ